MGVAFTMMRKNFLMKEMTPVIKRYDGFNNKTTAEEVIKSEHAMDLKNKTIVVTGGSSGLGKESVRRFYQANANVIMLNRNLEKSKKVEDEIKGMFKESMGSLRTIQCNFASLTQAKEVGDLLIKENIKVDIWLQNAGIMMLPNMKLTDEKFEMQIAVNHFNQFALMMKILPLMNQDSRIVTLSSSGHTFGTIHKAFDVDDLNFERRGYDQNLVYFQSKMCNLMTSTYLNKKLKDDPRNITVNSLRPGFVRTNLGNENKSMQGGKKMMENFKMGKSVEVGSSTQVFVCVDKRLKGIGGRYYDKCAEHEVSKGYVDDVKLQEKLFEMSLKLTNTENPFSLE